MTDPNKSNFLEALDQALDQEVAKSPLMQDPSLEQCPVVELPPDPYAHLIGRQIDPEIDRDPFTAALDAALAAEGVTDARSVETGFKNPESEHHEWESKRDTIYSGDDVHMICKKCFREILINRSQETIGQAMARHKISADCGMQLVCEVTDS